MTDRRAAPRHRRPTEHGIQSASLRPGGDLRLIDVSAGGALVDTDRRLLPGASVELHLKRDSAPVERIQGVIVRCAVSRLRPDGVRYRAGIAFHRPLDGLPSDAEKDGQRGAAATHSEADSASLWPT